MDDVGERGSRERVEHMINAGKYFVSLLSISLASVGGYSRITNIDVRSDPGQVVGAASTTVCRSIHFRSFVRSLLLE